ncbi:MAG TPA: DUF4139 domain-containing protein [candidate division Zixibacteria bacterium]|nr:DUF4139 domain-containing protein [candidate division Zixibacteria bacterium]
MKKALFVGILIAGAALGEIAVTIYSEGFALVKEKRRLEFPKGVSEFNYSPVPARITPQTVHLSGDGIAVLEQNYEFDIVSTDRLLQKNIDKDIRIDLSGGGSVTGKLLSATSSNVLMDVKGVLSAYRLDEVVNIAFLERPEKLYTRPTLVWKVFAESAGRRDTELSYMTGGLGWSAAYVAIVNQADTRLSIDGWVTINNTCGMTFEEATLKLVAGEVRRVEEPTYAKASRAMPTMMMEDAAMGFEEEAFFEYHLYTLPRPATVADRQEKQLSLFPGTETDVEKIFVFEASKGDKVRVELEFKNSEDKGMGMPLPRGIIRVYKEDKAGALQFVGEDRIDHTPKNEDVRIYLGNAFDIVAERVQKDYRRISNRIREEDYEIKIRNHKDEDIVVTVVEKFWGDWFIKSSNIRGEQKDSRTQEWQVAVPKDGETVLTFTVRFQ